MRELADSLRVLREIVPETLDELLTDDVDVSVAYGYRVQFRGESEPGTRQPIAQCVEARSVF